MKDETIIELTDEISEETEVPPDAMDVAMDVEEGIMEAADDDDEDVIELTEVVLEEDDDVPAQDPADASDDQPVTSILVDEPAPIDFAQAPQDRLEQALERVIERMYADQIDDMLKGLIKKIVTNEMDRIKARLLDEADADPEN